MPGFVRAEGEGPAPEIILYECLTDTSPGRDIPTPQVILRKRAVRTVLTK